MGGFAAAQKLSETLGDRLIGEVVPKAVSAKQKQIARARQGLDLFDRGLQDRAFLEGFVGAKGAHQAILEFFDRAEFSDLVEMFDLIAQQRNNGGVVQRL